MANQRGRNSGITGLVDIQGAPKFTARIYAFAEDLGVLSHNTNGRGRGRWKRSFVFRPGGTLALKGKVIQQAPPVPSEWRGQEGTIAAQLNTNSAGNPVKRTYPVRVISAKVSLDEKSEDTWDVAYVCEITGNPTSSGFTNSAPAADAPDADKIELYEGSIKTRDPDGLQSSAAQRFIIYPVLDSDAAEMQLVADTIAAAVAPMPGLKVRLASFARSDGDAGFVTLSYATTTTAEDVINAATSTTLDPTGIASSAATAAINGPVPVPAGEGFVETGATTQELNDGAILQKKTWGLRNSQQALEQDGSSQRVDPNFLIDDAVLLRVTASQNPPATPDSPIAGLKFHHREPKQLNNGRWAHIFIYSRRSTSDDIIQSETIKHLDPALLESEGVLAVIYKDTDTPATPASPIDGAKHIGTSVRVLHDTRLLYLYRYGPRTSQEQIELAGTHVNYDPNGLLSSALTTQVADTADRPATPAPPLAELKYAGGNSRKHKDGKWVHSFDYDVADSVDRLTLPQARTVIAATGHSRSSFATLIDGPSALLAANTEFSGRRDDVTLGSIVAQKVAPGRILLTIESEGNPLEVRGRLFPGDSQIVAARLLNDEINLFLNRKCKRGGGRWAYQLSAQSVNKVNLVFTLRRKVSGSTLPIYPELLFCTNNNPFMGLPAGTVKYMGMDSSSNIAVAPPRISEMVWNFLYDSVGHIDLSYALDSITRETTKDLTNFQEGSWVPASKILENNNISLIPKADFGVFLG